MYFFILSQQVIVCGIVYVLCLLTVLQSVTRNLQGELANWLKGTNVEPRSRDDDLSRRVKHWMCVYMDGQTCLHQLNGFFGWIFLAAVGLDFAMALGSGADLLISKSASRAAAPARDAWTACLFLTYTTVLYLPCVLLLEERSKLIILLRHLLWGIKRRTITLAEVAAEHENARILSVLPTFCHAKKEPEISQGHPLNHCTAVAELQNFSLLVQQNDFSVEAGGLFVFSRSYLVTIVTTLATLLLIAQEVLDRSESGIPRITNSEGSSNLMTST
ncbi:hypothetical protein BV898_09233 [Hypsibius exemplaris]|uniref:Gustatory receptor n=1 Tax=Hypsibius exemplaris TaxID=2072580 RepID=A0A1W0WMY4_HYPEX|nr:hypothetical protein BV898_09233 [Hypsibius exemplaris]